MEYEPGDPLCCCEYVNAVGEKSHVLAMFCDCQDLDEGCDRFLKGEGIGRHRLRQICDVVFDRIRIPTFFGAGAKRVDRLVDITALPPVFVVPLWLYIASFHPFVTLLLFCLVPLSVLLYYLVVLRHRRRTQFFMSWGLMSTLYIYGVFVHHVLPLEQVGPAQTAGISMIFVAMLAAFFASKHGPGVVSNLHKKQNGDSSKDWFRVSAGTEEETTRLRSDSDSLQRRINASDVNPVVNGIVLTANPSHNSTSENGPDDNCNTLAVAAERASVDASEWCQICRLKRPQRAGHCRICQHCVSRLDHHCVWIDSCVGEENHRSFLLATLLFVIGSLWGSLLTFKSLFPQWTTVLPEVSSVYHKPRSAIIFVSMCYALLAAAFMTSLLMVQFHNITHNWTSRERRIVSRNPEYKERLAEQDEGFCQNWFNFLIMQRSGLRKRGTQQV